MLPRMANKTKTWFCFNCSRTYSSGARSLIIYPHCSIAALHVYGLLSRQTESQFSVYLVYWPLARCSNFMTYHAADLTIWSIWNSPRWIGSFWAEWHIYAHAVMQTIIGASLSLEKCSLLTWWPEICLWNVVHIQRPRSRDAVLAVYVLGGCGFHGDGDDNSSSSKSDGRSRQKKVGEEIAQGLATSDGRWNESSSHVTKHTKHYR
jgi:hypothetical protein